MHVNDVPSNTLSHSNLTGATYTTRALSTSVAAANELTGGIICVMSNSGATPGTYTTRTAAQMIADGALQVGQVYLLVLANAQGTGTLTLAGGTGVTITGTATAIANTARIYTVTVVSPVAITIQNVCGGITAP